MTHIVPQLSTPGFPPALLLKMPEGQGLDNLLALVDEQDQEGLEVPRLLLCRFCRHRITSASEAVRINERHQYTFTNPAGITFRIGCFAAAPGCLPQGAPTMEFTWFAGFTWQVMLCGNCLMQMGWHFQAGEGQQFYGLILDRLIAAD